jgi:two-component system chemotaxis response regulator CheB
MSADDALKRSGDGISHDIVVVGGSAGGIEALRSLVEPIPFDLPATLFVVVHASADSPGALPSILGRAGKLPAQMAEDGKRFDRGQIYIAPADRHLLLSDGHMRVMRGPKENRHRPAIDPLFRSAAWIYGPRVIGIVLSGTLDDGSAGLWAIKARGGVTIVQTPEDAAFPQMPQNALRNIDVDYTLPAKDIAALLLRLASERVAHYQNNAGADLAKEVKAEMLDEDFSSMDDLGTISAFTCPGCGGALWQLEGGTLRYRCHTGHAFAAESLLAERSEGIERALYSALRALKEKAALSDRIAERLRTTPDLATRHRAQAREAEEHAALLRRLLRSGNG